LLFLRNKKPKLNLHNIGYTRKEFKKLLYRGLFCLHVPSHEIHAEVYPILLVHRGLIQQHSKSY